MSKKLNEIVNEKDFNLFKMFIETEASDYRSLPEGKREEWVNEIIKRINSVLPEKGNYIVINSRTNMGNLFRSLTVSIRGENWDEKAGNINIDFCSCGKLNHWGSVSQNDKVLLKKEDKRCLRCIETNQEECGCDY